LHLGPISLHKRLEDFHHRIECYSKDAPDFINDDYGNFLNNNGWTRSQIRSFRGIHDIKPGHGVFDWPLEESLYPDTYIGNQAIQLIDSDEMDKKKK